MTVDPRLPAVGSWSGDSCIIVGGGPSLKGFDWKLLDNAKHVIVLNSAFENVPTGELWFTKDTRALELALRSQKFDEFRGQKVASVNAQEQKRFKNTGVIMVPRSKRGISWSTGWGGGIPTFTHTGIGALNIAHFLGADSIYLLGFDYRNQREDQNYHQAYPKKWRVGQEDLDLYMAELETVALPRMDDVDVVNVINPDFRSKLDCELTLSLDVFYKDFFDLATFI